MTVEINTFYNYIQTKNTESSLKFKNLFENSIEFLPTKVCSSKTIYNILSSHTDINTNSIKQRTFRNAFNEYFRWKITGQVLRNGIDLRY
jgi:hypothetical protein